MHNHLHPPPPPPDAVKVSSRTIHFSTASSWKTGLWTSLQPIVDLDWRVKLKAGTHQADFKELATTKAASRWQCLDQKAALEHTAQTTTDCKLTHSVPVWEELAVYISNYQ